MARQQSHGPAFSLRVVSPVILVAVFTLTAVLGAATSYGQTDEWLDDTCCPPSECGPCAGQFFAGAEFLLVRPTFSQAIAFAEGSQGPTSYSVNGRSLNFSADGSVRAHLGYRYGGSGREIKFSFWHANNDCVVNGGGLGAGEFIVDPFGAVVGSVTVINPADNRFGTTINGGDTIRAMAATKTNVFDIDFINPLVTRCHQWDFRWSVGARIADVDQYYESIIWNGGALMSQGDFSVDFVGAGPRIGLEMERTFGQDGWISFLGKTNGSLLLGEHKAIFGTYDAATTFRATQTEDMTRALAVLETELGLNFRCTDHLDIATGYMVQAWWDLGTSGGNFGGFYTPADDGNIMAYDGLFLRASYSF